MANIVPADVKAMTDLILQGDFVQARKWHEKLFVLSKGLLSLATNPIPIKAALAMLGMASDELRLPMTALGETEKKFRGLAESTTSQISIIQDDRYVYANQAFCDTFRIGAAAIGAQVGCDIPAMVHGGLVLAEEAVDGRPGHHHLPHPDKQNHHPDKTPTPNADTQPHPNTSVKHLHHH